MKSQALCQLCKMRLNLSKTSFLLNWEIAKKHMKPNAVGRPFPCFFPKNGLTYLISDGGSP